MVRENKKVQNNQEGYSALELGKETLIHIASYLNIPLDETRLEDYLLLAINEDIPSVVIKDKKTNTVYSADLSRTSPLIDVRNREKVFNNVVSRNPDYTIKRTFYMEGKEPIIEELSYPDGDKILEFNREFQNQLRLFYTEGNRMTIHYKQRGQFKSLPLLAKTYSEVKRDGQRIRSFEQRNTDGGEYKRGKDRQDKYSYSLEDGIIYGINDYKRREKDLSMGGYCFEGQSGLAEKYFPRHLRISSEVLKDKKSGILFFGSTGDIFHKLNIYKNTNDISIHYAMKDISSSEDNQSQNKEQEYHIQSTTEGSITPKEIEKIYLFLQLHYPDNDFIAAALEEMMKFYARIEQRNNGEEEISLLEPKQYMEKPLEEIAELVKQNKDYFFQSMEKEYQSATNIKSRGNTFQKKW